MTRDMNEAAAASKKTDGECVHSHQSFVEALCSEVGLRIGKDIVFREPMDVVSKKWMKGGSLGIGESYMAGAWSEGPHATLDNVWGKMTQLSSEKVKHLVAIHLGWWGIAFRAILGPSPPRHQSIADAKTLAHYNIGNEFFRRWLDKRMVYTCGYWLHTEFPSSITKAPPEKVRGALEQAQLAKLALVAKKVGVAEGDTVLDIGCGWGALMEYLQSEHGAIPTGLTISEPQAQVCREKGSNLEVLVQDYREHIRPNYYNAVVSVGMLEHVGFAQLEEFFSEAVSQNLKEGGTVVISWIGGSVIGKSRQNAWIEKYIFPKGETPTLAEVLAAVEKSRLIVEDVQNLGPDYEKTLLCWLRLFESMSDDELRATIGHDVAQESIEVFRRMWRYYLAWCSVLFRTRRVQTYQVVLRKPVNRYTRYDSPMARYDAPR